MPYRNIESSLRRSVETIRKLQEKNGSWSVSVRRSDDMKRTEKRQSVFPAALILSALRAADLPEAKATERKAAGFLVSQKSDSWTWNYAPRESKESKARPYPDDLDDSACALAALTLAGEGVGGEALAGFATALVSAETREGGPYRTWLAKGREWDDVDVAVNANIAYALALHGVFLDSLSRFIDRAVSTGRFESLYYKSRSAFIYFIARFYALRGEDAPKARLAALAAKEIKSSRGLLETALCVSALARLGRKDLIPDKAAADIASLPASDSPLYTEEIRGKVRLYAGSTALTEAFRLEALSLLSRREDGKKEDESAAIALKAARSLCKAYFASLEEPFRSQADSVYAKVAHGGMERLIALLPYSFSRAVKGRSEIDPGLLTRLGFANMLGWMGYTIQDDVIDEGRNARLIPLSNILIRESFRILAEEADAGEGCSYVEKVFKEIDEANARECSALSLAKKDGRTVLPDRLPRIDERLLANKSFGHALGPLVILMKLGYRPKSATFRSVEEFFRHYIIARQLNDDAHDWQKDLREGRLNAASIAAAKAYVRKKHRNRDVESALPDLEDAFWHKAVDDICERILAHANTAIKAARESKIFKDDMYARKLVEPLARSAEKARSERDKALEFVENF